MVKLLFLSLFLLMVGVGSLLGVGYGLASLREDVKVGAFRDVV